MLPKAWYGKECNVKSLEDDPVQSKLHVMVMYRGTSCMHTTLRVYCQTKDPVFWDPAGGFAAQHHYAGQVRWRRRFDAPVKEGPVHENDVLVGLNKYLDWRKRIDTQVVEISELMSRRKISGLFFGMVPSAHIRKVDLVQMQWEGCVGSRLLNSFIVLLTILLRWIRFGILTIWQNSFIKKIRTE